MASPGNQSDGDWDATFSCWGTDQTLPVRCGDKLKHAACRVATAKWCWLFPRLRGFGEIVRPFIPRLFISRLRFFFF